MKESIKTMLDELEDGQLKANGFDDCIIGVAHRCSCIPLVVYSMKKIIRKLMKDMSEEEAVEHYYFNIEGAWMGEGTPLFLHDYA